MPLHSTIPPAERSAPEPLDADGFRGGGHTESAALPTRTIALGLIGALLLFAGSIGGAGVLVHDPIIGSGPLSAFRYGHGRQIATAVLYVGFALLVWAWIRLGRGVLAHRVDSRGVLLAAVVWIAPMLLAPPLFTRDVYSYLGQGLLALHGIDPYSFGPSALTGPIPDNVHPIWQTTPAPYGPLFIALAKGTVLLAGNGVIASVIVMRLVLLSGLVMAVFALPGLVHHLGGRLPVALWLVAASPVTVVHLVGGPHNDMLVVGLVAVGALLMLEDRPLSGIALVALAVGIKATAAFALPFLVWLWASRLSGSRWQRFTRALVPSVTVFGAIFAGCTVLAKVNLGWISALSAPGMIVNYLSAPTALGQVMHGMVSWFVDVEPEMFIEAGRSLGTLALLGLLAWQWWRAREGGPDVLRRAAIVLFASALLSPVVHPWYLTWGMALAAAVRWTPRGLSFVIGIMISLVLCYYPDGEQAMYNWPLVGAALGAGVVAGLSLTRFDPLGLSGLFRSDKGVPGEHVLMPRDAAQPAGATASAEPHTDCVAPGERPESG